MKINFRKILMKKI